MPIDAAISTLIPAASGLGGPAETLPTRSEPWDGPAALGVSDGVIAGATLDRNGLRPLRYAITADGWFVAGSEAGTVQIDQRT
ncbi:MAG: hypothetical protein ACLGH5_10015, partial [Actinomycetes bacterium]